MLPKPTGMTVSKTAGIALVTAICVTTPLLALPLFSGVERIRGNHSGHELHVLCVTTVVMGCVWLWGVASICRVWRWVRPN